MQIYTGDVIVVGGVADAEKNIDMNYEKSFLTKKRMGQKF